MNKNGIMHCFFQNRCYTHHSVPLDVLRDNLHCLFEAYIWEARCVLCCQISSNPCLIYEDLVKKCDGIMTSKNCPTNLTESDLYFLSLNFCFAKSRMASFKLSNLEAIASFMKEISDGLGILSNSSKNLVEKIPSRQPL